MISQKNKQGWKNPWVFGLLLIILAGVVINARFLMNVMKHPTRVLDEQYSVKAHNKYDAKWMQEQAVRSTLGWKVSMHSPQRLQNDSMAAADADRFILMASPAKLAIDVADRDGNAVAGGKIEINAQWPGNPEFDFKSELRETTPGHYEGEVAFTRAGNWDLMIRADKDGRIFDSEQKIFVAIPKS